MTKRALTFLIAALVTVGFAAVVIASSVGGNDSTDHMMPNGQSMTGESMTETDTMPATTHGMDDGSMMDGATTEK